MASAGTFRDLTRQQHYSVMADGFERGHLYIQRRPVPQLLKAEDPFHPSNKRLWLWDATLYEGHYYLYWGPVPALLIMAFHAVAGPVPVSDQTLTLLFMLGRLYAGAALILGLGRMVRTRQPAWLVGLAIASFGLTSPIPFILARPYVYEACLAAGQCFLFVGLAFAFWGVVRPERRPLKLGIAGISWGLAIGSRVTMAVPIPLLVLATLAVIVLRSDRSIRRLLVNAVSLGTPVAAALGAYALYNHARFDSVTEFGTTWQASLQRFTTASVFVIPNLYSYLLAPVAWSCRFPFVMATSGRKLSSLIDWPSDYATFEVVGGLLLLSGWCWLSLVVAYRLATGAWSHFARRSADAPAPLSTGELWALSCSLLILPAMAPVLGLWEASMRYTGDIIGGLMLATTLAAFWLRGRADASGSRALGLGVRALLLALGLHTCVIGALSGITSYGDPFKRNNPELYDTLRKRWSFCAEDARALSR
jgi:hypothetical protein